MRYRLLTSYRAKVERGPHIFALDPEQPAGSGVALVPLLLLLHGYTHTVPPMLLLCRWCVLNRKPGYIGALHFIFISSPRRKTEKNMYMRTTSGCRRRRGVWLSFLVQQSVACVRASSHIPRNCLKSWLVLFFG